MKTLCIVNPGRAVRHERKRHTEGAVLFLGPQDVRQLTASGDVSVQDAAQVVAPEAGSDIQPGALTADQVVQAFDAVASAIADGQLQPDDAGLGGNDGTGEAPKGGQPDGLTADQVAQALDQATAAIAASQTADVKATDAPVDTAKPAKAPAAKKVAKRRS